MKRKASEFEESDNYGWPRPASPSSYSYTSASTNESPQRFGNGVTYDPSIAPLPRSGNNFFTSRTRKRHRDNRPDAEAVHQNTLAKLFDAQRRARYDQTAELLEQTFPQWSPPESNQRSIDSFFTPHHPLEHVSQPQKAFSTAIECCQAPCEGCGTEINDTSNDRQAISQMGLGEDYQCSRCNRYVCDVCAVRGDHRVCLECALPGGGQNS